MPKFIAGNFLVRRSLETINSSFVDVPSVKHITHLQFRRFAGCPICNLHINTFVQRHMELVENGIQEIAIFHSSKEAMQEHKGAPFAIVADPAKHLYQEFGVETSVMSILNPAAWLSGIKGLGSQGVNLLERGQNFLGMPADFLIDKGGKILACKYGKHADDHWSVDEVLALSHQLRSSV